MGRLKKIVEVFALPLVLILGHALTTLALLIGLAVGALYKAVTRKVPSNYPIKLRVA